MGSTMTANIRARLEVIEALLRGELSREEARSRTEAIKRRLVWAPVEDLPLRSRLLLRIEKIEQAVYR